MLQSRKEHGYRGYTIVSFPSYITRYTWHRVWWSQHGEFPTYPTYLYVHSFIHSFLLSFFFFFACCFFLSLSLSFNIFPFPFLPFLHFNVVSFQKQYKNNSHKFYKYAIYVQVIKQHSSFGVKGISWHIKYKISKLNNKLNVWSLIYAS